MKDGMDIYGFVLAFERARNAPTMNGHRVLFRRLRHLIDNRDLDGFGQMVIDINQRMPGAPLSDLAQVWGAWRSREDDLDDLVQNPDWIKFREADRAHARILTKATEGHDAAMLKSQLVRLAFPETDVGLLPGVPKVESEPTRTNVNVLASETRENVPMVDSRIFETLEHPNGEEFIEYVPSPEDVPPLSDRGYVMTTWSVCTLTLSIFLGLLLYVFFGPS